MSFSPLTFARVNPNRTFRSDSISPTEADQLGTSAGRLARLVIETVARDRLFSAVIDAPTATGRNAFWTASSCVSSFASMSALPPKADIDQQGHDVRFVPKADMPPRFETMST